MPVYQSKRLPLICLIGLFFSISAFSVLPSIAQPANNAARGFQKLRGLAGNWEGTDEDGNVVKSNFKLVISDTALMETLNVMGMHDMLTIYSADNDGIALLHYCPTNNQPQMRALPPDGEIKELVFQFQRGGNLSDLDVGHEHKMVIQFEDEDHIVERWTWRRKGHDTEMVYRLTRKAGKAE
jgi:hypothetical protein